MLLPLLLAALLASPPPAAADDLPLGCVTLVSTSDLHGAIEPHQVQARDGKLRYGGLAGVAAHVQILQRLFGDRLLLLDSGDLYQGTLTSKLSRGKAVIEAFNLLGYRAAALGNHEFDFGPLEPDGDDVLGIVKQRISEARFPFLVLNVFDRGTGRRVDWPNTRGSVMIEAGGVKVGVIGISSVETPKVTRPRFVAGLEFREPAPLVKTEAAALRRRGAQVVVLLAHAGGRCADLSNPRDTSSCEADAELFTLLRALPAGTVDAALGGHSHAQVAHFVGGVAVIEPAANGRQLGRVDLCVGPKGRVDPARTRIHLPITPCLEEWSDGGCDPRHAPTTTRPARFMGVDVAESEALERAMKPYLGEVRAAWGRPVGARLPRPLRRDDQPSLGDLVCEAVASCAAVPIVVQNRGGVRADLPDGPLSFGQVFEVLPFDNHIAILQLTGRQLTGFVRLLVSRRADYRPYVAGLELDGPDDRLEIRLQGGAAIEPARIYTVATNDFLAQGGEGSHEALGELDPDRLSILDMTMLDALVAHLRRHYPDPPAR